MKGQEQAPKCTPRPAMSIAPEQGGGENDVGMCEAGPTDLSSETPTLDLASAQLPRDRKMLVLPSEPEAEVEVGEGQVEPCKGFVEEARERATVTALLQHALGADPDFKGLTPAPYDTSDSTKAQAHYADKMSWAATEAEKIGTITTHGQQERNREEFKQMSGLFEVAGKRVGDEMSDTQQLQTGFNTWCVLGNTAHTSWLRTVNLAEELGFFDEATGTIETPLLTDGELETASRLIREEAIQMPAAQTNLNVHQEGFKGALGRQ